MQHGYIQKLMDLIDIIGEEAFEEFFDELVTMYMYTINTLVFNYEDNMYDQLWAFENFKRCIPFTFDVLGHVILHEDPTEQRESIFFNDCSLKDHFGFNSGIDFLEALDTVELLLEIGEGEGHTQLYEHRYADLIIRTIQERVKNTA